MAIELTLFEKKHLKGLSHWGHHTDPRFEHYDFKYFRSEKDFERWFKRKQKIFSRHLFAIINDNNLVGFLTMKNIKWMKKQAELGIVLDPDKLGLGYGSEAVKQFLAIYFNEYKFTMLTLKVADFNRRAMRAYTKNGFKIVNSVEKRYEIQTDPFAIMLAGEGAFKMQGDKVVTLVHTMVIDRQRYLSINKEALCQL